MSIIAELLVREPGKSQVIRELRERLLNVMLIISSGVGTILLAFALIPAISKGLHTTVVIYSVMYGWTLLLTFLRRLPYRVRALGWLGMLYVFGCLNLIESGFNVDSGLFLITFIAMATLLMDLPTGLIALVLGSISISILGFVNTSEHFPLIVGLPQSEPLLWIIGGIIFFALAMLITYSLTSVVRGLEQNLTKATELKNEVEKTNQSLRLSEARYRTLLEASPGLVVLLDLQGNIKMVNRMGLALFGYEHQEEVTSRDMLDFIAPADQERVAEAFRKTALGGSPKDVECLVVRKDGTQFSAGLNALMVPDETGTPQSVICIGRDITGIKEEERILREAKDALAEMVDETTDQLKQTARRLNELVMHGPTVIFSYQPSDHAMTYVSENVRALLGYEASEFIEDKNFWHDHLHPNEKEALLHQMEQSASQDRSVNEYRFLKKDGTYTWLRGERVLQRDENGNPREYVGSWSDIDAKRQAEETLKKSEAKYRSLYENMMDAYVEVSLDGKIQRFNHAYERMLGYETGELLKLTYMDLTPEKWHAFEAEITEKQINSRGYSDLYEKEYIRKDGSIFPVELRSALIRDESGTPCAMWAFVRDISNRKRDEQILRDSERRYRDLLDNSMQGVFVFQDLQILYCNQAVIDSFGYTLDELQSLTPAEILKRIHPDDRSMVQNRWQRTFETFSTQERYSLRIIHKNGEVRWLEAKTVPIQFQGKPSLLTTTIDVTEIRRVDAELRESERTQRSILNASDAQVFLADVNGAIITANAKFMDRLGLTDKTATGVTIHDIFPPKDVEVIKTRRKNYENVVKSGNPIVFTDTRAGAWFENSFYPVLDETGKVVRVAAFVRDITEQRAVSEALRASEEQYRTLAEAAHDIIFIIDRDDRIAYVNSFGATFLGQNPESLVGQPRELFFPSDTNGHQGSSLRRVFQTGEAISAESENELPGQTVWLNTWLVPLRDATGEITSVLGVSRDITDRKKYEEALQQARDQLEERVAERTWELLDSQEKLRTFAAQTITSQENERRVLSRELHDEAGQALIILKYGLLALQSELPENHPPAQQRLMELIVIIDQTMQHIRALAHDLRPPVLEIGGINLSLQDYCQEMAKRTGIPIHYQGRDIPQLPDEISISLFRFVQEALTNSLKHSQATKMKVSLKYNDGQIILSVMDNGHGIDGTAQTSGLGLLGIKERLNLLDGLLEVHSQKNRGARLVARVPWAMSAVK